ncbi:MAG TPA: hypothetical protein PLK30_24340, partial [Blastocatellia bacterium]|nr:hypothetical protein [Blastocatellia bacterium]
FDSLVEEVKGHALTLNLLGTYLRDAHEGDIRRRDLVRLAEADAEEKGGHAFRVMAAYERHLESEGDKGQRALAILRLMGLFDRPATADCLRALWQSPAIPNLTEPLVGITDAQRNLTLKRLEDARLLTVNRDAANTLLSLDAHPLLREYFATRMKDEGGMMKAGADSSFIIPISSFREAHKRLYEHLCATTKEGDQPTLEELQPLYQAVAHGCQAGLQQEAREKVYRDRILRGDKFYSTRKLGAFGSDLGAVACFFDSPWNRVSPALTEADQAWLLNQAAFSLRALGRLTESLEPMRAGIEGAVKLGDWKNAATYSSNLSELELTLGLVDAAARDAAQSVEYADRSGDAFQRMHRRIRHADALHQAGRRAESETLFREAEKMQAERQPEYPLLYSLSGFQYCDLLLAQAERAAWGNDEGGMMNDELIAACRAVSERAETALRIVLNGSRTLLDIALNHLTLGRAALYADLLSSDSVSASSFIIPTSHLNSAVTDLRRSGNLDDLPRGLLTRAWLRSLTGALTGPDSAQEDLDEAWDIASRGSMKLFLADIHLYRARLFGRMKAEGGMMNDDGEATLYPWISPAHDLAEAERLINECGYGRRKEELADVKRAILGTP